MPPSPAAPCDRCQKPWIRVSPRILPLLFARSQTVLPSMRRARSPGNRLRAVSLRARLPSKDPQIAVRTRNQQVDEQALSSLKKLGFQSADDFYGSKRSAGACPLPRWKTDWQADLWGAFFAASASAIDFSIRPRSLLVERTAVVSFSNAARITSRLRKNEYSSCSSGAPNAAA